MPTPSRFTLRLRRAVALLTLGLGAKVRVEGLRRAGPLPTRAKLVKALESIDNFDLGGTRVNYSQSNRIGSRFVEVTVIGASGKLLR
jgi:hypothetical protein